jgi:succinoglycan biosynthesis transport protein ExoP
MLEFRRLEFVDHNTTSTPPPFVMENDSDSVDLRSIMHIVASTLKYRWKAIIITNAIALCIAFCMLALLRPSYKSTSEILLVDPKAHIGVGDRGISALDIDNSAINSEIELLRSRSIAVLVVKQLGLDKDPEFESTNQQEQSDGQDFSRVDMAAEALVKRIDVQRVPLSYALVLSVTSTDPAKAQRITQAIGGTFLSDQQSTRAEALEQLAAWWTQRVEQLRSQVVETDATIEKLKSGLGLSDGGSNPTLQKLAAIHADRQDYVKLKELEPVAESQKKLYEAAVMQLSEVTGSAQYHDTTARIITPASLPDKPGIKRKLVYLLALVLATPLFLLAAWLAEYIKGGFRAPAAVERATGFPVVGLIPSISPSIKPPSGSNSLEYWVVMARRISSNQWLNHLMKLTPQEVRLLLSKQIRLVWTSRPWLRAGRDVLGFAINSIDRLRTTGITGLSRQRPLALPLDRMVTMMVTEPHSELTDAVRAGRFISNLPCSHARDSHARANVTVVTSALPGEGKSATALLLATSSALSGARTVLVDGDLRRRSISELFRQDSQNGGQLLSSHAENEITAISDPATGLTIISVDGAGCVEASLLGLIARLSKEYDYVVVDSPPLLGATADALSLAGSADKILMVVEWGQTSKAYIAEAMRLLRLRGRSVDGIVLNKVDYQQLQPYGVYGYGAGYQ